MNTNRRLVRLRAALPNAPDDTTLLEGENSRHGRSRGIGMAALYRSGAGHATARRQAGYGHRRRLNLIRSTAYNPATGAGLQSFHVRLTLDSTDGVLGELCWPMS